MFALCWFLRRRLPEQGEPRAPVAIDGASVQHRETLHWRRGYYMFSIAVHVLVVMEMHWCVAAVAQERPAKSKMSKEQELTSIRALEKPTKKEKRAELPLQYNGVSIQIQTDDIMKYLRENRGKVCLYSAMHGKFQIELGLVWVSWPQISVLVPCTSRITSTMARCRWLPSPPQHGVCRWMT